MTEEGLEWLNRYSMAAVVGHVYCKGRCGALEDRDASGARGGGPPAAMSANPNHPKRPMARVVPGEEVEEDVLAMLAETDRKAVGSKSAGKARGEWTQPACSTTSKIPLALCETLSST